MAFSTMDSKYSVVREDLFMDSIFRELESISGGAKLAAYLSKERFDTDAVLSDIKRNGSGKKSNICRSVDDKTITRKILEMVSNHKCMYSCFPNRGTKSQSLLIKLDQYYARLSVLDSVFIIGHIMPTVMLTVMAIRKVSCTLNVQNTKL